MGRRFQINQQWLVRQHWQWVYCRRAPGSSSTHLAPKHMWATTKTKGIILNYLWNDGRELLPYLTVFPDEWPSLL